MLDPGGARIARPVKWICDQEKSVRIQTISDSQGSDPSTVGAAADDPAGIGVEHASRPVKGSPVPRNASCSQRSTSAGPAEGKIEPNDADALSGKCLGESTKACPATVSAGAVGQKGKNSCGGHIFGWQIDQQIGF